MTEKVHCGEADALIGYLYGESGEAERARVEAHLASCPTCAEELAALSATRRELAAWAPPDARLDFRLAGGVASSPRAGGSGASTDADVPPPRPWWSQPLPAWAQLAAAVVIFAAGLAIGSTRTSLSPTGPPEVRAEAGGAAAAPVQTPDVTRLEARIRELETRGAPTAVAGLDAATRAAIVQQVTLELERGKPWNRELFNVVVTMSDEFQKDIALLRREAGLDARMSTLASTGVR